MPPKKRTPAPAPTPSGMPSKFPTNPTVSPPILGTSTPTPSSTPRTVPSTSTSIVPPATVTPSESFSPTGQQDPTFSGELHPYGKNASRLASEIGIIVRDHAPHKVKGWSKVDNVDKEIIYTRIKLSDDIVELGRIELFRKTHGNATHGWINEEGETRYNHLLELRRQREDNNEVVDEAAICAQVLGCERNGYISGLGPVTHKGHTQTSSQVEAQIQQHVGDMADQMRMDFQRERNEMVTTLRRQLRDELLEEVEMVALMNGLDEYPLTPYQQQPPPPPPPPAPAV
ncbi:hypothetical protein TIFTF001_024138 [Ficus carica]|uniref:Uncharacterized protein n=1 Tax=Ficus carica TaxID=3494 RepID=A0AA88AHH2_FICCA|nr:hypothetical protein TIFTF001_024138 [Ficus carica]